MANEDSGTVLVRPLKIFMGQEGEGRDEDRLVMPDQEPFRVTRQRLADLKANGLVEEVGAASEGNETAAPPTAPTAAASDPMPDTASRDEGRATRGRPVRT